MVYFSRVIEWSPAYGVAARTAPVAAVAIVAGYTLRLHWSLDVALAAALLVAALLLSRVASVREIRDLMRRPEEVAPSLTPVEECVGTLS
jgi:hypothetical protein